MARWEEAPIVEDIPAWQRAPEVGATPSVGARAGRQVGLTARSGIAGVTTLPAMGADALAYVLNAGLRSLGIDYQFPPQMQALEANLSAAGLPAPSSPAERIIYDMNKALASTGGMVSAGRVIGGKAGELLTTRPDIQLESAAGSAGAAGTAREMGYGPAVQAGAGIAGGVAVPLAVQVVRSVPPLIQPFTEGGQNKIAGRALTEAAAAPGAARESMKAAGAGDVPESYPTMAAASRDPGLAALERAIVAKKGGEQISQRYLQNNAARLAELEALGGTADDIARAQAAREATTSASREAAFASARIGSPSSLATQAIDKMLKSPAGKQESVEKALNWVKGRLQDVTDPAELYSVRKDIGLAMNGKLAGERQDYRLASHELSKIIDVLDDVIESDAPGFKAYLQQYKDASKPINQMEVFQELKRRVLTTQEDQFGNRLISPAQFQRATSNLDDVAAAATGFKKARADEILTPAQTKRLEALRNDVAGFQFAQSGGKVAGSNTMQLANYSSANLIGRVLSGSGQSGPIGRNVMRAFDWLYKYSDDDVDRLLVQAAKDPMLASLLMEKATPQVANTVSNELKRIAKAGALGIASGETASQGTRQAQEK